jgi:hypothetical protein
MLGLWITYGAKALIILLLSLSLVSSSLFYLELVQLGTTLKYVFLAQTILSLHVPFWVLTELWSRLFTRKRPPIIQLAQLQIDPEPPSEFGRSLSEGALLAVHLVFLIQAAHESSVPYALLLKAFSAALYVLMDSAFNQRSLSFVSCIHVIMVFLGLILYMYGHGIDVFMPSIWLIASDIGLMWSRSVMETNSVLNYTRSCVCGAVLLLFLQLAHPFDVHVVHSGLLWLGSQYVGYALSTALLSSLLSNSVETTTGYIITILNSLSMSTTLSNTPILFVSIFVSHYAAARLEIQHWASIQREDSIKRSKNISDIQKMIIIGCLICLFMFSPHVQVRMATRE